MPELKPIKVAQSQPARDFYIFTTLDDEKEGGQGVEGVEGEEMQGEMEQEEEEGT